MSGHRHIEPGTPWPRQREVTDESFAPLPGASSFDAGHGEEPGQAAPRFTAAAAGTPTSSAARVDYIKLDDVADGCGVDAHLLHFRYRPSYWGIPKHWRWSAGKTRYAVAALPDLVWELEQEGLLFEAGKLRHLIATLSVGRGGTAAGIELETLRTTAAPAQDPWYRKGPLA